MESGAIQQTDQSTDGFLRESCLEKVPRNFHRVWFWLALSYALVCTLMGWGRGELWGNGGLRARVASEMAGLSPAQATNGQKSWWVPRLDGEPLLTKPPLQYWWVAGLGSITGRVGAFEACTPSVIAGLVILALAGWQGFLRFGLPGATLHLALVPTSIAYFTQVPSAELDFPLAAWVFAGLVCLDRIFGSSAKGVTFAWILFTLCLVGGFLQKWTGPVFLLPAFAVLLILRRGWQSLFSPTVLLVIACAAGISLMWLAGVAKEIGWDALQETVVEKEGMQHLSPVHHRRAYPFQEWFTYPFLVLGMGVPGCFGLLVFCQKGFRQKARGFNWREGDPWPVILLLGVLIPLGFWTLVPGHKPRHALPVIPPLVCLSAWALNFWMARYSTGSPRRFLAAVFLVGAGAWLVLVTWKGVGKEWEYLYPQAPTRLAAGIWDRIQDGDPIVRIRQMRDDGLQLALGNLGVRVVRVPPNQAISEGWFLATRQEAATLFAGLNPVMETTDQQGAPLLLFRLGNLGVLP